MERRARGEKKFKQKKEILLSHQQKGIKIFYYSIEIASQTTVHVKGRFTAFILFPSTSPQLFNFIRFSFIFMSIHPNFILLILWHRYHNFLFM